MTVGAGYETINNPEKVFDLTSGGKLDTEPEGIFTNLVDPDTLEPVSDFRVGNLFLQWKNKSTLPV